MSPIRLPLGLALCTALPGCVTATMSIRQDQAGYSSRDATTTLTIRSAIPQRLKPDDVVSDATLDGARVVRTADGLVQVTADGLSLAFRPAPTAGRFATNSMAGFDPLSEPSFGAAGDLSSFVADALNALPDQLVTLIDKGQPVPTAVTQLAEDFVAYKGLPAVGQINHGGLFAATVDLTDAGRAKLRAALAKRAATRP